jgi:hypothetical protein
MKDDGHLNSSLHFRAEQHIRPALLAACAWIQARAARFKRGALAQDQEQIDVQRSVERRIAGHDGVNSYAAADLIVDVTFYSEWPNTLGILQLRGISSAATHNHRRQANGSDQIQ